jgi:hypothetical protein
MNDVDLIGSGLAQLIIVARLCAWRGIRAEANRFGGFRSSHHGFSDLEFEQLGPLRLQLMGVLKEEGMAGVKRFARTIRKDRRDKPAEVLRLDKSIYGILDAGQSFSMYMVGLHLKHCGLVQAEMEALTFTSGGALLPSVGRRGREC